MHKTYLVSVPVDSILFLLIFYSKFVSFSLYFAFSSLPPRARSVCVYVRVPWRYFLLIWYRFDDFFHSLYLVAFECMLDWSVRVEYKQVEGKRQRQAKIATRCKWNSNENLCVTFELLCGAPVLVCTYCHYQCDGIVDVVHMFICFICT